MEQTRTTGRFSVFFYGVLCATIAVALVSSLMLWRVLEGYFVWNANALERQNVLEKKIEDAELITRKNEELAEQLASLEKEVAQRRDYLQTSIGVKEELDLLNAKITQLKGDIFVLENNKAAKGSEIALLDAKTAEAKAAIEGLKEQSSLLAEQLAAQKSECDVMRNSIATMKVEEKQLEPNKALAAQITAELATLEVNRQTASSDAAKAGEELAAKKAALEALLQQEGTLATNIASMTGEYATLQKKLEQGRSEVLAMTAEVEKAALVHKELEDLEAKRQMLVTEISANGEQLAAKKASVEAIEKQERTLNAYVTKLSNEYLILQNKAEKAKNEIQAMNNEMEKAELVRQELTALETKLSALQKESAIVHEELMTTKASVKDILTQKEILETQVEKAQQELKEWNNTLIREKENVRDNVGKKGPLVNNADTPENG